MWKRQIVAACVLASVALGGLAVWLTIRRVTGLREAWDSPAYLLVGLPVMVVIAAAGAFISPRTRFAVGFAVVSLQFAVLLGSEWNMGPLPWIGGGAFFLFFGMICTLAGVVGSALRRPGGGEATPIQK